MDFIEKLQALSAKIQKQKDAIKTEEATKNALILPFISALGYDVFDPTEVVPEYTADVGIKKGEKVDYAILRDGKVIILVECKPCSAPLADAHESQLYRYFTVTETARIAVLTDGITYRFYTDIEKRNLMDSKPFMEFNMLDIQEHLVPELKRLTKQAFDLDEIINVAGEMKYTREIKRLIAEQVSDPSDEYVRLFARQVYSGLLTQAVREQFAEITKKAFVQFINDTINDRLRSAMAPPPVVSQEQPAISPPETDVGALLAGKGIETTTDELQGLYIVRAILCETLAPQRVAARDALSYFAVHLDDNKFKPICRLYFDQKQKRMGLFNESKQEERVPIDGLNDIYKYAKRLQATVARYEGKPSPAPAPQ